MTKIVSITRPDDWHLHLRDHAMLRYILPETTRHFSRALIMPNLVPPVVTWADAQKYRDRIMQVLPDGASFEPKMTLYLTEATDPEDLENAFNSGVISSVKLYPAGATTNSAKGVKNFAKVQNVFEKMSELGCPLCVHGEVTDEDVDIFDREEVFIQKILEPIRKRNPDLKVVLEHITTQEAVDYVRGTKRGLSATITTHHLFINRNQILVGGIRPHFYCLPIAKREKHRIALREAATSGDKRFFLGTDSAPHLDQQKENVCGCAGCFTASITIPLLAQVFEDECALQKLDGFVSQNGAEFYELPKNKGRLTIVKKSEPVSLPKSIQTPYGDVTIFNPMQPIFWQVKE